MAGNNIHSQITDMAEIHVPKGFTEASNNTAVIKNLSGALEWRSLDELGDEKSNFFAVVDPTISNDTTQGYSVGSRWCNTVLKTMFECVSATTGAAIWVNLLRSNATATRVPTNTDDDTQGYRAGSAWVNVANGNALYICNSSSVGAASWVAVSGSVFTGQIDVAFGNFPEIASTGRYLDIVPYNSSDQLSYTVINTGVISEMSLQSVATSTGTVGIFKGTNLVTPVLTISLTAATKFVVTGQNSPVVSGDELVFQVTSGIIYSPLFVVKIMS